MTTVIENERATSITKLKEKKVKLKSQMFHERKKTQRKLQSSRVIVNHLSLELNRINRKTIKYYLNKLDKKRQNIKLVMNRERLISIKRVTIDQKTCNSLSNQIREKTKLMLLQQKMNMSNL